MADAEDLLNISILIVNLMNYQRIHDAIIQNRLINPLTQDEYGEVHHIIPRSFGGTDEPENLIRLSAREHFIIHYLLTKICTKKSDIKKAVYAFTFMKAFGNRPRYWNSRLYNGARLEHSKNAKEDQELLMWATNGSIEKRINKHCEIPEGWWRGRSRNWKGHTEEAKKKISDALEGRRHDEAARKKMSENNFARRKSDEHREHASRIGKIGGGKPKSDSHKENLSRASFGRMRFTDGITNISVHSLEEVPDGFWRGMRPRIRKNKTVKN